MKRGSGAAIRVLVVDDHAVVREGLRFVLSSEEGFDVVAEAAHGVHALDLAEQHKPDVVLLDISMPGDSGLRVAERLRSALPATRVIILSMHAESGYVLEAVRAGVHGYLPKDSTPAEVREAVRSVHDGAAYFSPQVTRHLAAALRGEVDAAVGSPRLDRLTAREREVLAAVATGRTNKEIAALLGISPRTVETHRENLMRKLEMRSVAELTRFAIESDMLSD